MKRTLTLLVSLWLPLSVVLAQPVVWQKLRGVPLEAMMEMQGCEPLAASRGPHVSHQRSLTAFVRTAASEADDVLRRHDCRMLARKGDLSIVSVPLDRLEGLAREPGVLRIEAGRRSCLMMDTTRRVVNAMPAYEPAAGHQAFTGEGVVVGLMDVGFDLTHPTFFDASGSRFRVGAFWDQLSRDTVGSTFPVGRDYIGYDEVLAYGRSVDAKTQNHGNHTAGIAVGSGGTTPYRGMATESDICLVSNAVTSDIEYIDSLDYYKYTTATDALGFKYLFDYADRQGKPCVVSFSEGYSPYLDSEDSLYAAYIDSLVSIPGHILVASAGNQNLALTYFEKPAGTAVAGAFVNDSKKEAMYKLKTDGSVTIRLHVYDGQQPDGYAAFTVASSDGRLDSLMTDTLYLSEDTCVVSMLRYAQVAPVAADTICIVMLQASRPLTELCPMALTVEGEDSRVEVYGTSDYAFRSRPDIDERWSAASPGHNIVSPGCFPSVLCVDSTSHRDGAYNYKGEKKSMGASASDGRRSYFSSTGPAMNGQMKPDVTAPGANIISAYSRYYMDQKPEDDSYIVGFSDFRGQQHPWVLNTGTSMSAPVVAGAIALWLQANPSLTLSDVKAVLSRTCRQPDSSMAYPNCEYGYGDIDVYRGLLDVLHLDAIDDLPLREPEGIRISPSASGLTITFCATPPATLTVRVYGLDGCCVYDACLKPSGPQVVLPLLLAASGVCVVKVTSPDGTVSGSKLVRF